MQPAAQQHLSQMMQPTSLEHQIIQLPHQYTQPFPQQTMHQMPMMSPTWMEQIMRTLPDMHPIPWRAINGHCTTDIDNYFLLLYTQMRHMDVRRQHAESIQQMQDMLFFMMAKR